MKRLRVIILALTLSGCALMQPNQEALNAKARASCILQGHETGSEKFNACVLITSDKFIQEFKDKDHRQAMAGYKYMEEARQRNLDRDALSKSRNTTCTITQGQHGSYGHAYCN